MIKVKLRDLNNSASALKALVEEGKLRINIKYGLSKMIPTIEKELKDLESTRAVLVRKYGVCIDTTTDKWEVKRGTENYPIFENDWNTLLETEVELVGNKIDIIELAHTGLTSAQLYLLDWMLNPPDEAFAQDYIPNGRENE